MSDVAQLSQLTLDEFIVRLISGHSIAISGSEKPFVIENIDTRVALSFYEKRRECWDSKKNVDQREIEALYAAIETGALPQISITAVAKKANNIWHLKRVEAFRFGGLHKHCHSDDGTPPEIFSWDVESPLTLIRGFNGAGKTSLLNAIVWCLTGYSYRSQTPPASNDEPITIVTAGHGYEGDTAQPGLHVSSLLSPVIPVPSRDELVALKGVAHADTRVTLTFVSNDSKQSVTVSRTIQIAQKGKFTSVVTGIDALGISNLSIQIGTVMPGVLSHMRLGEKSDIGSAISQLTGVRPAEEFGKRCMRIVETWLKGTERRRIEQEKAQQAGRFDALSKEYAQLISANEQLKTTEVLVSLESDKDCSPVEKALTVVRGEHAKQLVEMSAGVESLLKRNLTESEIKSLSTLVAQGLGAIENQAMQKLTGIQRSLDLKKIYDEIPTIEEIINNLIIESAVVALEAKAPLLAARRRLYSRIAEWHKQEHPGEVISSCPLCATDLSAVPPDSILKIPVKDALEAALKAEARVAESVQVWEEDKSKDILERLPQAIRNYVDDELPASPLKYFDDAMKELMDGAAYRDILKNLALSSIASWDEQKVGLPAFHPPQSIEIDKSFNRNHRLWRRVNNLVMLIAFSKYRHDNENQIKNVLTQVLMARTAEPSSKSSDSEHNNKIEKASLKEKLIFLELFCKNSDPLQRAIRFIDLLSEVVHARRQSDKKDALRVRTIAALQPLAELPTIVKTQVEGLLSELRARTDDWLTSMYKAHYLHAPKFAGVKQEEGGKLLVDSMVGGTVAPAEYILNAAAIRAVLWALLFSLWERIFKDLGGLSLFLFDDPQAQFDPLNAENFACSIPAFVNIGARPILTSNDKNFLEKITSSIKASGDISACSQYEISPVTRSKTFVSLLKDSERISVKRGEWKNDDSNTNKAVDFIQEVRVFLEERLWDLLADDPVVQHDPTFGDLLGRIASLRNNGQEPFDQELFGRLTDNPKLKSHHAFYKIINTAHHKGAANLTPTDARDIDMNLDEIQSLVTECRTAYLRYMRRIHADSFQDTSIIPSPPISLSVAKIVVPMYGKLAAKSLASVPITPNGEYEKVDLQSALEQTALYSIRSDTLGMACWPGQTAIVSLTQVPSNGDLVICLTSKDVFARRLAIVGKNYKNVILQSESSHSGKPPKPFSIPRSKVRLLKIVGVLFDADSKVYGTGDAVQVDKSESLQLTKAVLVVDGDSASPVANAGQKVLVSPIADISSLNKMYGQIVAVVTVDNEAYLKRVGKVMLDKTLILEKVGMNGETITVSLSSDTNQPASNVQRIQSVARVHGVLYS